MPQPTLADAGISKHLADRARKMAAVPEPEFEGRIAEFRARVEEEGERVTLDLMAAGEKHVRGTFGTGMNEWFTPPQGPGGRTPPCPPSPPRQSRAT